MIFAALSNETIQDVLRLIEVIFTGTMSYLLLRLKQQQTVVMQQGAVAAANTELVSKKLDVVDAAKGEKLEAIAKVVDATHALSTNNLAIQLRLNADNRKHIAELTGTPEDLAASLEAERLYSEHMARQPAETTPPASITP